MSSLSDALLNAGLVSKEAHERQKADERQRADDESHKHNARLMATSRKPVNFDRLNTAETVGDFRKAALDILLEYPDAFRDVLNRAHEFKTKEGGKKLDWWMYQVRDKLFKIKKKADREKFLRRALRRSNPTLDWPPV